MDDADELVTIDEIRAARTRLDGVLRDTPVRLSEALTERCEASIGLKHEHLQRTGSFKIRGAFNHIVQLAEPTRGVVAASAGNHAQGVALAATMLGRRAVVYMPENAPLPKITACRRYGAEVRLFADSLSECLVEAHRHAELTGDALVPPFDDPAVIAGQGTLGLELLEQMPELRGVVVPVGGGGLISGIAVAVKSADPTIRVIGVEAEGAASVRMSIDAGEIVPVTSISTIADGIAVKAPSLLTFTHIRALVDDVVVVDDEQLGRALIHLLERSKAVVEPSGAAGVAAVQADLVDIDGPVAVVLSGGNVDPLLLSRLIEHGMQAAGRYVRLRVIVPDRPGSLAHLTRIVADADLDVLSVEHHRLGVELRIREVEIDLTLEARDGDQAEEAIDALTDAGYRVIRAG